MLLIFALLVNVAFGAEFTCNFDKDNCGGINRKDDKFDWSRRAGSTPSSGTGPPSDHGGNGFYAYIETSSPRRQGDNAKLEFSGKDLNSDAIRISFYYHMFGANVGSLKVFVNGQQEFSKSGSQGNKWVMADFKVQKRLTNIVFEGVRGNRWQGDIAIDDLKIVDYGGGGGEEEEEAMDVVAARHHQQVPQHHHHPHKHRLHQHRLHHPHPHRHRLHQHRLHQHRLHLRLQQVVVVLVRLQGS
ncbi:Meprin A subunit beta [Desmophyllum pertusum]|uniref:Meprin A subunit beta n=1 Tax=Desmophyllum pertusum TaxID=174260 RepID=A0A9X0DB26_9CNID|nr:Meprin A subunit beta [Desmophyllum pertusum]